MSGYIAWHICNEDKKLLFNDNRKIKQHVTHAVKFPCCRYGDVRKVQYNTPKVRKIGLHGAFSLLNALSFKPTCAYISLVEISGNVDLTEINESDCFGQHGALISGRTRKYIKIIKGKKLLQLFVFGLISEELDTADRYPDYVKEYFKYNNHKHKRSTFEWATKEYLAILLKKKSHHENDLIQAIMHLSSKDFFNNPDFYNVIYNIVKHHARIQIISTQKAIYKVYSDINERLEQLVLKQMFPE